MSVLKNKRKECKAEYVNETYKAYIQTVEFVSKMSARYSRLIGSDIRYLKLATFAYQLVGVLGANEHK